MARHVKALTYVDKIDAVRSGACRQTIRVVGKRPARVGDVITFHGWIDRPYRSPWSWRLEVIVQTVEDILITQTGIRFYDSLRRVHRHTTWDSFWVEALAIRDFINPPTGEALKDVLFGLNGAPTEPIMYQIIRW